MGKILSQAGTSLADVYDVEGSVAGIDELLSREVSLVHELGRQIHSERLQSFVVEITSGAKNQSTSFAANTAIIPDSINRILGCVVLADTAARMDNITVSLRGTTVSAAEMPFYVWDTNDDAEVVCRIAREGESAADEIYLRPTGNVLTPLLITRFDDANIMPRLQIRGTTGAFGAGTVTAVALVLLCRPDPAAPTPGHPISHGLPIPGW